VFREPGVSLDRFCCSPGPHSSCSGSDLHCTVSVEPRSNLGHTRSKASSLVCLYSGPTSTLGHVISVKLNKGILNRLQLRLKLQYQRV